MRKIMTSRSAGIYVSSPNVDQDSKGNIAKLIFDCCVLLALQHHTNVI